jgi:hypothetical protein
MPGDVVSPESRSPQKLLASFLGVLMLTFGSLKFFSGTIDGWFTAQIQQSHLPLQAILIGKLAEIVTGVLFLLPRFWRWDPTSESRILLIACLSLSVEMLVATYVHLQPGVPAAVLPLGIKAPVMPLAVLGLDVIVGLSVWKGSRSRRAIA